MIYENDEIEEFLLYYPEYSNNIKNVEKQNIYLIIYIDNGDVIKYNITNKTKKIFKQSIENKNQTKEEISLNISRNIIDLMNANNLSQSDIANYCGVSQSTISNYLNCKNFNIPIWIIYKIADMFNVNIIDLCNR